MVGLSEANILVENHLNGDVYGYEMSILVNLSREI